MLIVLLGSFAGPLAAAPGMIGQTGLINMPDARIEPDGTFRLGLSNADPYRAGWVSLSLLPWFEASGRYTRIAGVPGFGPVDPRSATFGAFKDKSFDAKIRLWDEGPLMPSVAFGFQDIQGTELFRAQFLAASKRFGPLDVSAGYGRRRIDGAYAGVRYSPARLSDWSFVAEYDANDYRSDFAAAQSGAARRNKGIALGAEYRWGWFGVQGSWQHREIGLNAYVSVPTDVKAYVPRIDEPAPYLGLAPRPHAAQFARSRTHARRLRRELEAQDFANVRIAYANDKLSLSLTNSRISGLSRAVGRAARTALAFAPLETREIEITYTVRSLPVATYSFFDVPLLRRYFNGMASRARLAEHVAIRYAVPAADSADRAAPLEGFDAQRDAPFVRYAAEGDVVRLAREDAAGNQASLRPQLAGFFNDPSGAFHYELSAVGSVTRNLGGGWFFDATAQATVLEDVSKVTQPSNSLLPHVRSDVAQYKRDTRLRLNRALVSRYFQPGERLYARASAGIYEDMFSGAGGQALYMWPHGDWAADASLDWLRQRDTRGFLGLREYRTVTAIASIHRRLPLGIAVTLRAGRFLAGDEGARVEFKRRLRSGIEFGGWYSRTNGNDITSPGSPSNPYNDKGIFLSIPLEVMLTRDTQASAGFSLSPWTRDVGQMVASPGDLYALVEKPLLIDARFHDGLSGLGDVEDDYPLPDLGSSVLERSWAGIAARDASSASDLFGSPQTWKAVAAGGAATVLASALDAPGARFAREHGGNAAVRALRRAGDAVPLAALAAAGLAALDSHDRRLADTGIAALQAGLTGVLADQGLEFALGRSRPEAGMGRADFHPMRAGNLGSSLPSTHAVLAWALVTPFAREYEAPWLYGAAALTNFARVSGGRHWLSDTVAGALIGYATGSLFWQWRRKPDDALRVDIGPGGIRASVPLR